MAIVEDADQGKAAALDEDLDLLRAGVDAVLEQFFDDRGGALDDFASGDLARQGVRHELDARHG